MNEIVLKVEALHDNKCKKKALKVVSRIPGIDSVCVDMKDYKLTLIGEIDPVTVVAKLRKLCHTEILSLGPAKPKVDEKKNNEEDKKKNKDNNEEDKKKVDQDLVGIVRTCEAFEAYHHMRQHNYCYMSVEENPSVCVIL